MNCMCVNGQDKTFTESATHVLLLKVFNTTEYVETRLFLPTMRS